MSPTAGDMGHPGFGAKVEIGRGRFVVSHPSDKLRRRLDGAPGAGVDTRTTAGLVTGATGDPLSPTTGDSSASLRDGYGAPFIW